MVSTMVLAATVALILSPRTHATEVEKECENGNAERGWFDSRLPKVTSPVSSPAQATSWQGHRKIHRRSQDRRCAQVVVPAAPYRDCRGPRRTIPTPADRSPADPVSGQHVHIPEAGQ